MDASDAAQRVIGGGVGHSRGRGRREVNGRADSLQRGSPDHDLFGERAVHGGSLHSVARGEGPHTGSHRPHGAGEFAADREGNGDVDLVLIGDQEHVGKIHGGGGDVDHHLPVRGNRVGHLDHDDR